MPTALRVLSTLAALAVAAYLAALLYGPPG